MAETILLCRAWPARGFGGSGWSGSPGVGLATSHVHMREGRATKRRATGPRSSAAPGRSRADGLERGTVYGLSGGPASTGQGRARSGGRLGLGLVREARMAPSRERAVRRSVREDGARGDAVSVAP